MMAMMTMMMMAVVMVVVMVNMMMTMKMMGRGGSWLAAAAAAEGALGEMAAAAAAGRALGATPAPPAAAAAAPPPVVGSSSRKGSRGAPPAAAAPAAPVPAPVPPRWRRQQQPQRLSGRPRLLPRPLPRPPSTRQSPPVGGGSSSHKDSRAPVRPVGGGSSSRRDSRAFPCASRHPRHGPKFMFQLVPEHDVLGGVRGVESGGPLGEQWVCVHRHREDKSRSRTWRGRVSYCGKKGVRICLGDTATAKCLYQGGTPGTGGDEGEKSSVDFGERVCGGEGIVRKPAGGAQGG